MREKHYESYLIMKLSVENIKNVCNSVIKRQPNQKIGERFEWIFLQRGLTNGPTST
jgi:hypothetical protein